MRILQVQKVWAHNIFILYFPAELENLFFLPICFDQMYNVSLEPNSCDTHKRSPLFFEEDDENESGGCTVARFHFPKNSNQNFKTDAASCYDFPHFLSFSKF